MGLLFIFLLYNLDLHSLNEGIRDKRLTKQEIKEFIQSARKLKDDHFNKKGGLLWRSDNYVLTSNAVCTDRGVNIYFGRGKYLVKWNTGMKERESAFQQSQWEFGHKCNITSVELSQNGKYLVTAGADDKILVWSPENGKELYRLEDGHKGGITCMCVSSDSQSIVTGGKDKLVILWNISEPASTDKPRKIMKDHKSEVYSVTISHKKDIIASSDQEKRIRLWKPQSDSVSYLVGHTGGVLSVRFSPIDNLLVSGSEDKMIKIWD